MAEKRSKSELEQLFRLAGCKDPEGWAHSEFEEDISRLSRYLFLRMMLECVVEEGSGQKMANVWHHNDKRPVPEGSQSFPKTLK
jgi:hypothetical protein